MRRRIVALYIVLAVIVSSVVSLVTYRYSTKVYIREVENSLKHDAALIAHILSGYGQEGINDANLKKLSGLFLTAGAQDQYPESDRRITIINKNGDVLADSKAPSYTMENHLDRPEIQEALMDGIGVNIRKSETTGIQLIYLAYYSGELDKVVRISTSVEYVNEIRNVILFYAIITVFAAMIISSLIALKFSGYVVKPLARLVKEYGNTVEPHGITRIGPKDEVGQLSLTLSNMTHAIENVIKELKERNARVDAIISSMDNGLIAVDRSMQILMVNPIAIRIFCGPEIANPVGLPLVQVIRNRQINELLLKAITDNKVIKEEMHVYHGGRRMHLSVHVSPIYQDEDKSHNTGALAFINDVTQMRKFDEMRAEFVSNVTHELKTPLTSIQGFVETLKNGALHEHEVAEKFLDIIDIEATRLRNLINDILELSEIEHMKKDIERQSFELLPLVNEVESMLHNAAAEKGVTIKVNIPPDLLIEANRHRIKQLLINLMDNAIKYNRTGGIVKIWVESFDKYIEIHVRDTGIGIPREHTDRIFERFYRVDKGRSRAMGGTGLGLSIVKHIAQLYEGSVRVESKEGEGSDFIVRFPRP